MLRVLWPEGEPSKAFMTSNLFSDWWASFRWSLRGKRTCRVHTWLDKNGDPVQEANILENIFGRNR